MSNSLFEFCGYKTIFLNGHLTSFWYVNFTDLAVCILIFLLSLKAGLREKEMASLQRSMVTDAGGNLPDVIHLTDAAAKGRSGLIIPINKELSGQPP